jgi:hypothetical protein
LDYSKEASAQQRKQSSGKTWILNGRNYLPSTHAIKDSFPEYKDVKKLR